MRYLLLCLLIIICLVGFAEYFRHSDLKNAVVAFGLIIPVFIVIIPILMKMESLLIKIALFVTYSGVSLNGLVVVLNNGRMPIQNGYTYERWFGYDNKSDINLPFLADIFPLPIGYAISVGDMFILTGLLFGIICFIKSTIWKFARIEK